MKHQTTTPPKQGAYRHPHHRLSGDPGLFGIKAQKSVEAGKKR
jgi:hypothetical protein